MDNFGIGNLDIDIGFLNRVNIMLKIAMDLEPVAEKISAANVSDVGADDLKCLKPIAVWLQYSADRLRSGEISSDQMNTTIALMMQYTYSLGYIRGRDG